MWPDREESRKTSCPSPGSTHDAPSYQEAISRSPASVIPGSRHPPLVGMTGPSPPRMPPLTQTLSFPLDPIEVSRIAASRWFSPTELLLLLRSLGSSGFISSEPNRAPTNGSLHCFNPVLTPDYKADGCDWVRRKGRESVREDMVKMGIAEGGTTYTITGRYTHSISNPRFCRRVYELANMPRGNVIVHYRLSQAPDSGHQGSATDRAVSSWLQADRDRGSVLAGCNKASGGFASGGACDSDYGSAEAMDEALLADQLMTCADLLGLEDEDAALIPSEHRSATGWTIASNIMDDHPSEVDAIKAVLDRNKILDFEPKFELPLEVCPEGTVVLIVLERGVSIHENYKVSFGDITVPASIVSPCALKCTAPRSQLGSFVLELFNQQHAKITDSSPLRFVCTSGVSRSLSSSSAACSDSLRFSSATASSAFFRPAPEEHVDPTLGSTASTISMTTLTSTTLSVASSSYSLDDEKFVTSDRDLFAARSSTNASIGNPMLGATTRPILTSMGDDKQHKVRIVERLGSVVVALSAGAADPSLPSPAANTAAHSSWSRARLGAGLPAEWGGNSRAGDTTSASPARLPPYTSSSCGGAASDSSGASTPLDESTIGDGWLDDKALNNLSVNELEGVLDAFIGSFMSQLVQFASVDIELQHELNMLDTSGFALLHYCCLYDLGDLVGLLLCKRATDINLTTSTGVSALHLAAGAGNLNIVLQLLRHGADPRVLDQSGHTPAQYAAEAGYDDLSIVLLAAERSGRSEKSELTSRRKEEGGANMDITEAAALCAPPGAGFFSSRLPPSSNSAMQVVKDDDRRGHDTMLRDRDFVDLDDMNRGDPVNATGSCDGDGSHIQDFSVTGKLSASSKGGSGGVNLLQVALSSLSLHDQCALSKGLGSMGVFSSPPSPSRGVGPDGCGDGQSVHSLPPPAPRASAFSLSPPSSLLPGDGFDSQGAWSESEQHSLEVAMSKMGPRELAKMEEEVKLIQNNVRTWLLRKNYINLRDAARVLQAAWRERKQALGHDTRRTAQHQPPGQVPRGMVSSTHSDSASAALEALGGGVLAAAEDFVPLPEGRKKRRTSERSPEPRAPMDNAGTEAGARSSVALSSEAHTNGKQGLASCSTTASVLPSAAAHYSEARYSSAALTLQAATRQMLARRRQSFQNANRQAMASLVIQKSLLQWWNSNKQSFNPCNR